MSLFQNSFLHYSKEQVHSRWLSTLRPTTLQNILQMGNEQYSHQELCVKLKNTDWARFWEYHFLLLQNTSRLQWSILVAHFPTMYKRLASMNVICSYCKTTLRCSYIAMALKDLIPSFEYWSIILLSAKIIKKNTGKGLSTRSRQCRICLFNKCSYSHIQLRGVHCIG